MQALDEVVDQEGHIANVEVGQEELNWPEDEMLTLAQGLRYDPTVACDTDDDFEDTMPVLEHMRRYGMKSTSNLEPLDVYGTLKVQRSGFAVQKEREESKPTISALKDNSAM